MGLLSAALGRMTHYVRLEDPGTPTADGDGGYTETWTALNPADAWCSVKAAGGRTGERRIASTVVAQATHEVVMRYHTGVSTKTRIRWRDQAGTTRALSVVDVDNVDERGEVLRLSCVEVTQS